MSHGKFSQASNTIVSMVYSHGRWRGTMPAVTCGSQHLNWQQLNRLSNRIGRSLVHSGVRPGDRVALLTHNRIETYACYLGIWKALGVVVPLSTLANDETLKGILADCDPRVLIVDPAHAAVVGRMLASGRENKSRQGPEVWTLPETSGATAQGDGDRDFRASASWSQVLDADDSPLSLLPALTDDCTIVYTSGTTGEPKGVVHTHGARVNFALARSPLWRIGLGDRFLTSTPLYHNGAMVMLIPAAINGGHLCIMERFDTFDFIDMVNEHDIQFTFVVPTQVTRLLADEGLCKQLKRSTLQKLVCAGAPLPDADKAKIVDLMGHRFAEVYGGTEGYGTTIDGAELLAHPGSVGRPMLGSDLKLIDDNDQEAAVGQIGEVVGRSSFFMRGYYRHDDVTESTKWADAHGVEFFRSGDLGRFDSDGYLSIVGRKKDMLISGGVNVYPRDLEIVLESHPLVAEVAVVGLPDARWGELPGAAVVPVKGALIDEPTLLSWANERLGRHQRIHRLILVEELPRNVLAKVVKANVVPLFNDSTHL